LKCSERRVGRVFILMLEDGNVIPESIEGLARKNKIAVKQET
jgi:predicted DNA-binding protein with PD1-like motif